jgi:hypothetical protein
LTGVAGAQLIVPLLSSSGGVIVGSRPSLLHRELQHLDAVGERPPTRRARELATEMWDRREIVTPIWAVVVDGVPYIRSGYARSHWYRRVQGTGRAGFIDSPERYAVTIENLNGEAINRKVDEAYRAKYAGRGRALRQVVSPQVRAYAMRIIPE